MMDLPGFRKSFYVRACFTFLTAGTLSVSAYAVDIIEAYRLAQGSDPVFESARYALASAQQKIPQARAGLLPAAGVVGNKGYTRADTRFTGEDPVDRHMKSWAWNLQLTQPLIHAGNLYAYRESELLVEQATAQYAKAEQDMLLRVAEAYFGVLIAQEAIAAADAQISALDEQLGQVKRGYALGTHSVTDIDETKSRLGSARSQKVAALNDLASKRADLEKVTGQELDHLAVLGAAVTLPEPVPMDARTWMDHARTDNASVRAQTAALAAAKVDIKKNRSDYLPTIDLTSSYGSNYASNSLTTPNDYATRSKSLQIGLQVNIPLYSGGMTNARVSEAVANAGKARADLEAASRQAATDAQQAFAGVVNGLAQIDALNSAVESGESAVKGNRAGYHLGIRINLDVLNAEQQLYAAKKDLAKARYDTLLQGLKLKAAAGNLEEADLLGINDFLVRDR
jgi:outer membrane protein